MLIKSGAAAYDEIGQIFSLPSTRYLRDFQNAFNEGQGVQHGVLKAMRGKATLRQFAPAQMYGALKWDAMNISEG
jgi:hypothetical protein